jgi:hypothetical protein
MDPDGMLLASKMDDLKAKTTNIIKINEIVDDISPCSPLDFFVPSKSFVPFLDIL